MTERTSETERKSYGQFQPASEGWSYLLYDGPEEWGLRLSRDGTVAIGPTATIDGEHPNYVVSLPSGMKAFVGASSRLVIAATGFTGDAPCPAANVHLADALRDALSSPGVTSVEPGCTCGGMAACVQCQERDAEQRTRPGSGDPS